MTGETESRAERRETVESLPSVTWRRWVTGEFRSLKKWIKVNLKLNYRALRREQKLLAKHLKQLNGAHEKEKENRVNFVLKGTYDSDVSALRDADKRAEDRIGKLELAQSSSPTAGLQSRLDRAEERIAKVELGLIKAIDRDAFDDYKKSQAEASRILASTQGEAAKLAAVAIEQMRGRIISQAATIAFVTTIIGGIVIAIVVKWLSK